MVEDLPPALVGHPHRPGGQLAVCVRHARPEADHRVVYVLPPAGAGRERQGDHFYWGQHPGRFPHRRGLSPRGEGRQAGHRIHHPAAGVRRRCAGAAPAVEERYGQCQAAGPRAPVAAIADRLRSCVAVPRPDRVVLPPSGRRWWARRAGRSRPIPGPALRT
jgi:hypothetical protein